MMGRHPKAVVGGVIAVLLLLIGLIVFMVIQDSRSQPAEAEEQAAAADSVPSCRLATLDGMPDTMTVENPALFVARNSAGQHIDADVEVTRMNQPRGVVRVTARGRPGCGGEVIHWMYVDPALPISTMGAGDTVPSVLLPEPPDEREYAT